MLRKLYSLTCIALLLFVMTVSSGCFSHTHVIGNGGMSGDVVEQRQWYVLWGLVPINDVDTVDLAEGASNYTIETEFTPIDFVINIFTSLVTVYARTVTVTK